MNKIIIGFGIVIVGLLSALLGQNNSASLGSYSGNSSFGTTATSGVVTLTATDVQLVASSTLRNALILSPLAGCVTGAYISFANDSIATALNSVYIASSTVLYVNSNDFPYTGAIHAITAGGACSLSVTGR